MKTILRVLVLTLVTSQALAAPQVLEGETASGDRCALRVDAESSLIGFSSGSSGFDFYASKEDIAGLRGRNAGLVSFSGVDGNAKARLALFFSSKGQIEMVTYNKRAFVNSKRVECRGLKVAALNTAQ